MKIRVLTDYRAERLQGVGYLPPLIEGGQGHDLTMPSPAATGALLGVLATLGGLALGLLSLLAVPV